MLTGVVVMTLAALKRCRWLDLPNLVLVLAVLVIAGFSLLAWQSYQGLLKTESQKLEELAIRARVAFVSHVGRLLDYGDSTLRSARAVYLLTGSTAAVYSHVAEAKAPRPDAFSGVIAGIDAGGAVIFHTHDQSLLNKTVNTELDFFRTYKDNPSDRLFLDPTRIGRNTGLMQFRMVRPMLAEGRFGGVVLLNMEPNLVTDFAQSLNLGVNAISMVLSPDARLVALDPLPSPDAYLAPAPGAELWRRLNLAQDPVGRLNEPVVINGIARTFYYAKVKDYPLIVAVGLAQSDIDTALAEPRRNLAMLTLGFAATTFIIAALLMAFIRANSRLIAANQMTHDANLRLQRSNAQLERSNADLEQFAYVASHDLQTPLRNMSSFAQLLALRYSDKLDQDGKEFIGYISAGAQQMSSLVHDLLGYARVSSQGRALVPCSATDAVQVALHQLEPVIRSLNAKIDIAPLPEILGDPLYLPSLFRNLLENALKYHRPGIAPEISVWAERMSSDYWRLSVADNGLGIDPAFYDKIFVIFQRLHPVGEYEGTGIGLALCKRIVIRMGGEIGVGPNDNGVGSVFCFTALAPPGPVAD